MVKPGERVGAISHSSAHEVFFYGWGTYVGDHTGGPMDALVGEAYSNPKIELDDGGVVWGCEC